MEVRRINTSYFYGGGLIYEFLKNNYVTENYECYVSEKDIQVTEKDDCTTVSIRIKNFDVFRNIKFDNTNPYQIDVRFNWFIAFSTTNGLPTDFKIYLFVIPFTEVWLDLYYPKSYRLIKSVILDYESRIETIVDGIRIIGSLLTTNERSDLRDHVKNCRITEKPYFHTFQHTQSIYAVYYSIVYVGDIQIVKIKDNDSLFTKLTLYLDI